MDSEFVAYSYVVTMLIILRWFLEIPYYGTVSKSRLIESKTNIRPHKPPTASSGEVGLGHLLEIHKIINMVANRHKEIKEQFATNLHLHLHGAAALEGLPASDDQS